MSVEEVPPTPSEMQTRPDDPAKSKGPDSASALIAKPLLEKIRLAYDRRHQRHSRAN